MSVVVFDIASFRERYPQFNTVAEPMVKLCFTEATMFCNNTDTSFVTDVLMREIILEKITAHILQAQLVGRVSSATEGSVSVSAQMPSSMSAAWFMQTTYGASAWALMSPYRRGIYISPLFA
jgi:hypothetical protein